MVKENYSLKTLNLLIKVNLKMVNFMDKMQYMRIIFTFMKVLLMKDLKMDLVYYKWKIYKKEKIKQILE